MPRQVNNWYWCGDNNWCDNKDFYFLSSILSKVRYSLSGLLPFISRFRFFALACHFLPFAPPRFFKPAGRFHGAPFTAKFVTLNWRARAPRCLSRPLMRLAHREISVVSFFIVLALRHPLHGWKRNDRSFLRSSFRRLSSEHCGISKHRVSKSTNH